jgi:hypothetical protein
VGVTEGDGPLTSWTRTLNEDDACVLLDLARPGLTLDDWTEQGHRLLPQAGLARRREQIRIVQRDLLDHDGEAVIDSAFLRLFQDGAHHRRRTLLLGRLLRQRPFVDVALDDLIHPALAEADRPLAPEDADLVPAAAWTSFLLRHLRPGIPDEALRKTRTTVQGALRDVGVLEITGNTSRTTRVRHGRPDPLGFAWLLARELVDSALSEVDQSWALHRSFAARLFATEAGYAASCIDAGMHEGLLRSGHLMGRPLVHPGML